MRNIGGTIKERREQLGLTLEQVGDYIGVGKATVQRYESGEIHNLKQETIEKLSEILKVSPSYLMGWEEKKPNTLADIFANEEFSDEELGEIKEFVNYIKSKRK